MPLVKVSWPYDCNHMAMVAGCWANWRPQVLVPMKTSSGEVWSAQIKLPDNVDDVFRYKFIVDGDWKYDSALPTLPNDHGDFDNYLVVCQITTYFLGYSPFNQWILVKSIN